MKMRIILRWMYFLCIGITCNITYDVKYFLNMIRILLFRLNEINILLAKCFLCTCSPPIEINYYWQTSNKGKIIYAIFLFQSLIINANYDILMNFCIYIFMISTAISSYWLLINNQIGQMRICKYNDCVIRLSLLFTM